MKPRFNFFGSGQWRFLAGMGFFLGAILIPAVLSLAQNYPPGVLYVAFDSGAVSRPLYRPTGGQTITGITYIDDINTANKYLNIVTAGHPALPSTRDYYFVLFPDTADLLAIADAYLAEPTGKVLAAGPDYFMELDYTPNDPFLYRNLGTPHCRQWALDSTHCQFEKAWDITRGDSNVTIVADTKIG